jgi:hypothetical protein
MRSVIESGTIKRNKGLPIQEDVYYEMRFVDESSLNDIMALQDIIINNLDDKEIFRNHSIEYFRDHFKIDNSVIGAFTDDGLIAYSILYIPGEKGDNFGSDVNLPRDELKDVVHLETVAVHPAYRGNLLQRRMQGIHLEEIKRMSFKHVCCMVSPKNRSSLQNIFSNGFVIKALKVKFGWRLRYIMHKNLHCPNILETEEVRIDSSDIDGQVALLNSGFLGFQIVKGSEGFEVVYGRECKSAI